MNIKRKKGNKKQRIAVNVMIARVAILCSNCFLYELGSGTEIPQHLFRVRCLPFERIRLCLMWPCDRHKFVCCSSCFSRRTVDYTHGHCVESPQYPIGDPHANCQYVKCEERKFFLQSHTLDRTMNGN